MDTRVSDHQSARDFADALGGTISVFISEEDFLRSALYRQALMAGRLQQAGALVRLEPLGDCVPVYGHIDSESILDSSGRARGLRITWHPSR